MPSGNNIGPKRAKHDFTSGQPKPSGKANPGDVTIKDPSLYGPQKPRGNGPLPPKWMEN